jgi:hypothetical protein
MMGQSTLYSLAITLIKGNDCPQLAWLIRLKCLSTLFDSLFLYIIMGEEEDVGGINITP